MLLLKISESICFHTSHHGWGNLRGLTPASFPLRWFLLECTPVPVQIVASGGCVVIPLPLSLMSLPQQEFQQVEAGGRGVVHPVGFCCCGAIAAALLRDHTCV